MPSVSTSKPFSCDLVLGQCDSYRNMQYALRSFEMVEGGNMLGYTVFFLVKKIGKIIPYIGLTGFNIIRVWIHGMS